MEVVRSLANRSCTRHLSEMWDSAASVADMQAVRQLCIHEITVVPTGERHGFFQLHSSGPFATPLPSKLPG